MLLIKRGNLHLPGQQMMVGDVLIEDGHISKIGTNISAQDACVIDAQGKEVLPGFILPLTSVGLVDYANLRQGDSSESSSPCNPQLHVRYALDGREVALQKYWKGGITSFGAAPGDGTLLAGQMGVYHITGMAASQMCVCDTVALKGSFNASVKSTFGKKGAAPMTRMGMASQLRAAFWEAKEWMEQPKPEHDPAKEVLARVLRREIPLLMNVTTAADIADVIAIAEEYNIRLILNGAYEGDKLTDMIAQSGAKLVLGDQFDGGVGTWYGTDIHKLMAARDFIPMCIGCSAGYVGKENLLWNGCRLVQQGYAPADVLDMMTVKTAEVLGVDHLIGSIQEGLFADLMIYRGNPLEKWSAVVDTAIVAGKVVYEKEGAAEC